MTLLRVARIVLALLACISVSGSALGQLKTEGIVQDVGIDQHLDAQLPLNAALRDEDGNSVHLGDYFHNGKPVILNFVYYKCPMLCTQVLNGLLRSSQGLKFVLGEDYHIVSISIDPRESPEVAAAKKEKYAASYRRPGAEEGWHFLTADQATIDALTQVAGFRYRYDERSGQYAHASGIMLVTPQGRIARYMYGIDYNPNDLRLGLVETSQNRIGSVVDQVLLLCYHYDPATGKYGIVISRVIQVAGITTMVVLGVFLTRMWRKEVDQQLAENNKVTSSSDH